MSEELVRSLPIPESGDVDSELPEGVFGLSSSSAFIFELVVLIVVVEMGWLPPLPRGEHPASVLLRLLSTSLAKQNRRSKLLDILLCHCFVGESTLAGAFITELTP